MNKGANRRESASYEIVGGTPKGKRGSAATKQAFSILDISNDESLDPDLRTLLLENDDDESVAGDVSFSDEESTVI